MRTIGSMTTRLKVLLADLRRARESRAAIETDAANPDRQVEESLHILETALSRLAHPDSKAHARDHELPEAFQKTTARVEKEREDYAARARDLQQTLDRNASAFREKEKDLKARIRQISREFRTGTQLLEDALREIEKLKKSNRELIRNTRDEAHISERIAEATSRVSQEYGQEVEALRGALENERAAHRRSLVEQARKIADLRRSLKQTQGATARTEERLAYEKRKASVLVGRLHEWKAMLGRDSEEIDRIIPAGSWLLRLEDGTVFGPADIGELYRWSAECRIGPDHEISEDGQVWTRAANIEELRMDWFLRLRNGSEFGPINIFAVEHLVNEDIAAPDTRVTHRSTGAAYRADNLGPAQIAELTDQNAGLLAKLKFVRNALVHEKEWGDDLGAGKAGSDSGAAETAPPKLIRHKIRRGTTA